MTQFARIWRHRESRLFLRVLAFALLLFVSIASAALLSVLVHERAPFFYRNF
jgi:hypothetical protein